MTNLFVIFNPAARGEKSVRLRRFLEQRSGAGVTLAPTSGPGDAGRLATAAAAAGARCVVAAGGDGTINEVVNGLGPNGPRLGVLPLGTVNVFARELGLGTDIRTAWSVLEAGRERVLDLARAEAGDATRYFVQLAGVGLDAWAVQHASWELKKKIGPLSYLWAGLKAVRQPGAPIEVATDAGEPRVARGVVVLVGNGRFYGGEFPVFPRARLDDGLLDVCVFQRGGYLDVLRYAVGVTRGTHVRCRDVDYFQATRFTCRAGGDGAAPFELDGELAGRAPVTFSVLPGALRVAVP
ncbi:diacylglycerol kinase family lipid kinase [bacterium]|nr:diacylglycerol kinase family lipid kinase [bacterium]